MSKLKKHLIILITVFICAGLLSCASQKSTNIAATTLPVFELTSALCQGTDLTVSRLITEEVSCLHDYTLQVSQMRMIESAEVIVISGGGLEEFPDDALSTADTVINASAGIELLCFEGDHEHGHEHDHAHSHEHDPHIWLSPANGKRMAQNICSQLSAVYPDCADIFKTNLAKLEVRFDELTAYAEVTLADLTCRELITFHDGFAYMAQAYDLTILHAIEEESGSETSASELIELITLVEDHALPAIFTERSGSTSAASIVSAETGAKIYDLDMAMAGSSYFEAMYHNIDTLREALE